MAFFRKNKLKFTDLELLKTIHSMYGSDYLNRGDSDECFYIPIKCDDIAKKMKVDVELVFQRLYNHLEKRHGYKNDDGSNVHFFAWKIGDKMCFINYPYLSAILSHMEDEKFELRITQVIAITAVVIALVALLYK